MRITLAVFAIFVALFLPGTAAAIPPGNDAFASATSVGILPFNDALSLDGATTEPGEPQACNFQQQSVWYSVTPAAPTAIRIDVNGSDFGVVANLWRGFGGGLGGLGFQGCLGFGGNITLPAEAGATYYIQAGSVGIGPASLNLNVQQVPPPANDAFADSKTVGSLPYVDFVDMLAATVEPGEQTNPPGVFTTFQGSAWYAFTAPTSTSMLVTELRLLCAGGCRDLHGQLARFARARARHASVRPERLPGDRRDDVHDPARPGCGFRKLRVARDSSGGDAGAERDGVSESVRSFLFRHHPVLRQRLRPRCDRDRLLELGFRGRGDWNRSGCVPPVRSGWRLRGDVS